MSDNENTIRATPKADRPVEQRSEFFEQEEARQIGQMSAEETKLVRARQDARSKALGMILLGMCVLFFAITVVKVGVWG